MKFYMKKILIIIGIPSLFIFSACSNGKNASDASGVFEAEEVIVSSELAGKILEFQVEEGDQLAAGQTVATIDATNLKLQKEQVEASIGTLKEKVVDVGPQIRLLEEQLKVQQTQLNSLLREKNRYTNLVKDQAATQKQLDDISSQYDEMAVKTDRSAENTNGVAEPNSNERESTIVRKGGATG
jgi:HlyD family secretion protein